MTRPNKQNAPHTHTHTTPTNTTHHQTSTHGEASFAESSTVGPTPYLDHVFLVAGEAHESATGAFGEAMLDSGSAKGQKKRYQHHTGKGHAKL